MGSKYGYNSLQKIASNVLFSSNEPNQTEFITIQFEDDDDRVKQFHHWLGVRESWKINLAKTKKTREWYLRFNEILQEVENSNLRKEIVLH